MLQSVVSFDPVLVSYLVNSIIAVRKKSEV